MWEKRLRLWSGLIIAAYVVMHLLNHGVGLISLPAMEAVREVNSFLWPTPLLIAAFLFHFFLSLFGLYTRSTLRMPIWEAAQLSLGILVVPLILIHVIGTTVAGDTIGFDVTYEYVIAALWVGDPMRGLQQTMMMLIVWGHASVGIHYWLRNKAWYGKFVPYIYGAMLLIPVVALLGFARVGRQLAERAAADPDYMYELFKPIIEASPTMMADITQLEPNGWLVFAFLIASVFVARLVRHLYRSRHGVYHLTLEDSRVLSAPVGQSILETLRVAGVPHASVCGGRGRCTTCRVHVGDAFSTLPKCEEVEQKALNRIKAEPEVRLACQCRPRRDLSIRPLLPPNATAQHANSPGGIQGREQKVAVMFLDLRGSTKLGEEKLPYDVLFILNQFFAEMAEALVETNGHYAQFSGDGLMALYGVNGGVEEGCRDAIRGAQSMMSRMEKLNARLAKEVKTPLAMGIGIHCGDAIVGTMGPPTAQNFSAIGDDINISARLESLSKTFGCFLVLSEDAANSAGVDATGLSLRSTEVRGRDAEVAVYAIDDPRVITFA